MDLLNILENDLLKLNKNSKYNPNPYGDDIDDEDLINADLEEYGDTLNKDEIQNVNDANNEKMYDNEDYGSKKYSNNKNANNKNIEKGNSKNGSKN